MCGYVYVSDIAASVASLMESCEATRTGSSGGTCDCPADIMSDFGLALAELADIMAQQQPAEWTDPGQYCGGASCDKPNCITLPR